MLLDAHCHLTGGYQKDIDLKGVLARAALASVCGMVAVGTDLEDSKHVLALAEGHKNIRAALGVHPHDAKSWDAETGGALRLLLSSPLVLFVGETGLDWHYCHSPKERQEDVFRRQIALALEIGKPLMIHTRSAPEATLRILEEESASDVGGVIHCFTENPAFAERVVALGFHISFSGILTFPGKDSSIREAAAWVPEDRILVETDAPFLAPVPHRGRPNEPAFVSHTAQFLANLRGWGMDRLCETVRRNMLMLTGWEPSA